MIVNELFENQLLTEGQAQRIVCKQTPIERTQALLSALPTRGPNAFIPFIQILDKYYPELATRLLDSLINL